MPGTFHVPGTSIPTPYHSPETTARCRAFALRHGLLVTGGSDCHGAFADRQLGIPPVTVEELHLGNLVDRAFVYGDNYYGRTREG